MKKRYSKIFITLALVALIAALALSLAACNPEKKRRERDAKERANSVEQVEDAFLGVLDEKWSLNMSDLELVNLNAPGDYIVASGWTKLFGEVLNDSALQTAKLKNLANAMYSDEGKALLENVSENAELLLPVLKEVGFTKNDISSLFYGAVHALVQDSGDVLDKMYKELERVRALSGLTSGGHKNVTDCMGDVNSAKTHLVPADGTKQQLIAAFDDAKGAVEGTIGFAYDLFFNTLSEDVWQNLFSGDGALENITDDEIRIVMDSLLSNVAAFKSTLTEENIAKTNRAFDLLIANFDEETLSSALFAQIIVYAKYANMFVGVAPLLLDVISSAGQALASDEVLGQLRQNSADWSYESGLLYVNSAALAARLVKDFMDSHDGAELKTAFDGLFEMSGAGSYGALDSDKATLILAIDVLLNMTNVSSGDGEEFFVKHPEIIGEDGLADMFSAAFMLMPNISRFKETYRQFNRGETDIMHFIAALNACGFRELGVLYNNNEQITAQNIDAAYEYYIEQGVPAVNRHISELTVNATADIKRFVDDFYAQDSECRRALNDLAEMPFATFALNEEQNAAFEKLLMDSGMSGIMLVVAFILG